MELRVVEGDEQDEFAEEWCTDLEVSEFFKQEQAARLAQEQSSQLMQEQTAQLTQSQVALPTINKVQDAKSSAISTNSMNSANSTTINQEGSEVTAKEKESKSNNRNLAFGKMIEATILYLKSHYHLRYNVLTDVTEMGHQVQNEIIYQPITRRQMNSICLEMQVKGVGCWGKDVDRCIDSEYVESYHPIQQYIEELPAWDGIDRVTPLAQRVSHNEHWVNNFHVWMRGMMAQWMGLFNEGGHATYAHTLAPILISPNQGCGKSTFCKSLLPKELRVYYTDSFDVFNNNAADKKLAKNALINLDEFDSLTKNGNIRLKNHMQKTDLTYRVGNQKLATTAPRLASFIGTTNQREVLFDPTGSRRFICVEVEGLIDNHTPIEYAQLYAQLKQELEEGLPYWLSKEEEKQLERENRAFYHQTQEETIFFSMFRFAQPEEDGAEYLSSTQIYRLMRKKHHGLKERGCNAFGKLLSAYQKPKKTSIANVYCVVRIQEEAPID
jgi:predicted P-loop ATPase